MLHDFYKFYSMTNIQRIITEHLIENCRNYTDWHGGNADQLVYEATEFFNDRNFTADVVDIIVQATGDALDICIKILRKSPAGNIQITETGNTHSPRVIHLKLSGDGGTALNRDYTGDNHYDALTLKFKKIPKLPDLSEPEQEKGDKRKEVPESCIDLTTSPLKKRSQKSQLEYEEFVDLTESPVKFLAYSDTELFTQSQSEDETGSFVSEFAEPIDVITDALKEAEQTDAETEERDDEAEMETEYDEELINQYLRPSTIFPTFLFRNIKPKRCNFLPQNIDGIKYFKVKCSIKNYSKKTSDRRWFYLRTSSKTGLNGIRKVGTCKGSWQCTNTSCSFLRTEKKPNTWHFDYRGGSRACYSCGTYAQQLPCGARKLVQMAYGSEYAEVYHIGKHNCTLQPELVSDIDYTTRWVQRYPGISHKELKSAVIQHLLDTGNPEEAEKAAYRITTQAYRKVKRDLAVDTPEQHVETQSLEAVAELKKGSDQLDPLHIYKINSKAMNNQPDYVMKSSSKILKVALMMDQDAEDNPLQKEDAYFDGCHSRCTGFISLGLWVQHPSMRRVLRLASMEVRSEATEDIAIFFKLFNEMLQIVGKKDKDYKFNPRYILCDEAGGNIRGIKEALGLEFAAARVVTCQWHFMNKMNERMAKIGEDHQEEFADSAGQLCKVQSVAEFELIFGRMRDIVSKYPEFGNSLEWYYARRFHLFPAFRDGLHSGLNLAEVGNAQWKPKHKMSLVSAAKDDITTMLQQESDLKRFSEGSTFKKGKVLTDQQRATQERRQQMEQARSFAQVLQNPEALQMQIESEQNPDFFIPRSGAGHKPTKKTKGVEGKTVRGRGRGRGKPKETPTLDSLLEKLNRAKRIERGEVVEEEEQQQQVQPQESNVPVLGSGPEPRKVRPIKSTPEFPNPPYVVHSLYNVSRCQGCPEKINSSLPAPHDLFFRMKAVRPYQNKETLVWHDKVANAYFHLNTKCLQKFDPNLKLEDITMTNEMFYSITDGHLKLLAEVGVLKYIIANKGAQVEVSNFVRR